MDFDLTQVLELHEYLDDTEVEELDEEESTSKAPVGYLKVFQFKDYPENSFPIYEGDNFIGRDDRCNITIPTKPISKKHACIEVQDELHLVYDCDSRNKTRRNKIFLKPHVRYELKNEDQLIFADVICQYQLGKCKDKADDKLSLSGSETGSESMLPDPNQETEDGVPNQDSKKLTSSSPKLKDDLNESPDTNQHQPIQDYKSKNLEAVSPLFCPETDDDTDDEQDANINSSDNDADLALHFSAENTEPAEGKTENNQETLEDTLPATVPVERDTVPITPGLFAEDDDTSMVLKRAVDVRCDPFKRLSTGNTLDYGLETLESPNKSRESADTSGDESAKDDTSRESSPVRKSKTLKIAVDDEIQNKDDDINTADHTTTSRQTPPKEDTDIDDLMATQAYEVRNIPESPVSSDGILSTDNDALAATQAYGVTNGGNATDEENLEDMPTLPYEVSDKDLFTPSEETGDELATQAYGLSNDDRALTAAETGDEDATQVYGHGADDSKPQEETGEKDGENLREDAETGKLEEKLDFVATRKKSALALYQEVMSTDYDLQSTQIYSADRGSELFHVALASPVVKINLLKKPGERTRPLKVNFVDSSESESAVCSNHDIKPEEETVVSSDSSDLPIVSFADLGIPIATEKPSMDSDEDFLLPGPRSTRRSTPNKRRTSESALSAAKKSPSVVIEGENSLSSVKRCYVECVSEDKTRRTSKMSKVGLEEIGAELESTSVASSGRGKTRGRGRRPGARQVEVPTKRGRKGRGRREEKVDEEITEGDEKEKEYVTRSSKKEQKEEDMGASGKKKNTRDKDDGNSKKKGFLKEEDEEMIRPGEVEVEKEEEMGASRKKKNKKDKDDGNSKKKGFLKEEDEEMRRPGEDEAGKVEEMGASGKKKNTRDKDDGNSKKKGFLKEEDEEMIRPGEVEVEKEEEMGASRKKKNKKDKDDGNSKKKGFLKEEDEEMRRPGEDEAGKVEEMGASGKKKNTRDKDDGNSKKKGFLKEEDEEMIRPGEVEVEKEEEMGASRKKKNKKDKDDGNSKKKGFLKEEDEEMIRPEEVEVEKEEEMGASRKKRNKKDKGEAEKEEENTDTPKNKLDDEEHKEQGGTLDDNQNGLVSGENTTAKRRKKSSVQRGKMGRKGTFVEKDDSETKRKFEESGGEFENFDKKENTRGRFGKRTADKNSEDGSEKTGRKGRMGRNKNHSKATSEEDDIFKFDDHDPKPPPPRQNAVAKRLTSRTSAAASASEGKSGTGTETPRRSGGKSQPDQESPKQAESSEVLQSFKTPEVTVSSSQRSRRSSTSSDTSSQGTKKRRREQDSEGQQGDIESPVASPGTATPSKRTKLEAKAKSNVKVMFTGLTQEVQARKIVDDLQGEVVESVYECTHLVTDKVRRTVKFLCALSRGIPLVDKRWLQACKKSKSFIDCSGYTVKDKASEKQYEFSLDRSLEMARSQGLLEGYQVHVTPNVMPKPEFMKDIIQCANGEFQATIPESYSKQVLIISCEEDRKLSPEAFSAGHVHSPELLLTGVLRQQLDLVQYKMNEQGSSTPAKKSSRRR